MNIFFPLIFGWQRSLKDLFSRHGIRFGMAGEYYQFESSVTLPIIKKHCATFTSEVSMKMEYTQPAEGVWNFTYADRLSDYCKNYNIDLHGHCAIWHMQNPDWLPTALQTADEEGRYYVLARHVINLVRHYAPVCQSMDIVNEFEPATRLGYGWGAYLGMDAGSYAMGVANLYKGGCLTYYNSFFRDDSDADYAISLLPVCDGIGVQLHLNTWTDYTTLFARISRMAEACKVAGKRMRFSEISVCVDDGSMDKVADVYRQIVRLALSHPLTVTDFVTWGVKGQTWNGGYLLFDREGRPNAAFAAVVEELSV